MSAYEAEVSFQSTRARWQEPSVVAVACLLMAIPVFLTSMPPVMDFPNHLARFWLLAGGADKPPLSAIYEIRWWQASTNIGVDFIASLLVKMVGLDATAKVLLVAMFVGPALGAAVLNRALYGRFQVWQLLGVMVAWSTTAIEGFASFHIGIAAGLVCAAAARPLIERLTAARLAVIALTAAVLLLIHPFGAMLFIACLIGFAFGERLPAMRSLAGKRGLRIVAIAAAGVLPLLFLYLLAPHPPGMHSAGRHWMEWEDVSQVLRPKHLALLYFTPFLSYRAWVDLLIILPLAGVLTWIAVRGWIRVHAGLFIIALFMLAITPALPANIGDGGALPVRFPVMACFIAIAATTPHIAAQRARALLAAVLVMSAMARAGTMAWIWHSRATDAEQLREATAAIPPGASVLLLQQKWGDTADVPIGRLVAGCPVNVCGAERHFGSLVVPWRQAFVPTLFTVPGQHPIGVKMPWRAKSVIASGIPFADEINLTEHDPYLVDWQDKFDYVLLLNADLGRTVIPNTEVLEDAGFARLYRVTRRSGYARSGMTRGNML